MELSYFELGSENKKNILVVHGWAAEKERFRSLSRELVKRGWHVVAVDLPGFGKTPLPRVPLTAAGYAGIVRDVIRDKFSDKPFIVFGHSFGGRIAARIAKNEKNVKGLVLCAPGIGTSDPMVQFFYKIIAKTFLFFPPIRKAIIERYYKRTNGIIRIIMRGLRYEDPKKTFGGIKVPTLILWGANDKVINVEAAETLKEFIPRSLVRIFPGIGHSLPYYRGANIAKEVTTWSNTFQR